MPLDSAGDATTAERLNHALRLARLGLLVFPLRPGSKEPFSAETFGGKTWLDLMTTDPATIRGWFAERPDMNYGCCPGEGFVVIDLDVKGDKNGVKTFASLVPEADRDTFRRTIIGKTPTDGRHVYLRVPYAVTNSHRFDSGSGIDVRGWRGYVVGPGCRLANGGEYVIRGDTIADAPPWLMDRLRKPRERDPNRDVPQVGWDIEGNVKKARNFLIGTDPAVEGEGGDDWTFKTACVVRDFSVSEDLCVELMADVFNPRCEPPWDVYGDRGTLQEKVRNAYRYAERQGGDKATPPPEEMFEGVVSQADDVGQADEPEADGSDSGDKGNRWSGLVMTLAEAASIGPAEMVVPGWLPMDGYTCVLARRGVGKTVIMLDLALRIAADMDLPGAPTMKGLWCFYLAGEAAALTRTHAVAWCRRHLDGRFPQRFRFAPAVPDLMDAGDCRHLADHLGSVLPPGERAVLFVDTWQRATLRGGQNRDDEMQRCVHHVESVARSLRGPAVLAFHPPKHDDRVVLGSSVVENSSAAIWQITEDGPPGLRQRRVEVTRLKSGPEGSYAVKRIESQETGDEDQFGDQVTGAVAEHVGGTQEADSLMETRQNLAQAVRDVHIADVEDKQREGPCPEMTTAYAAGRLVEMRDRQGSPYKGTIPGGVPKTMERELLKHFGDEAGWRPVPTGDGFTARLEDTRKKWGAGTLKVFRFERVEFAHEPTQAEEDD